MLDNLYNDYIILCFAIIMPVLFFLFFDYTCYSFFSAMFD